MARILQPVIKKAFPVREGAVGGRVPLLNPIEKKFWCRVYLQSMQNHPEPRTAHYLEADKAVLELRFRGGDGMTHEERRSALFEEGDE